MVADHTGSLDVSIVVASNRDVGLLEACLESLVDQVAAAGAELIVARHFTSGEADELRVRFRAIRLIDAEPTADIPMLRGLGLGAARGDLVLLTEDHCVAEPTWVATLAAAAADSDVVGGGMGNAQTRRAIDWAAYFAEYGFFGWTRQEPAGALPLLTGANVGYRRRWLSDVTAWAIRGEWENVAHDRVRARGGTLRFVPNARVLQNRSYRFFPFCVDRYEHGRDYARTRVTEHPETPRWPLLIATPLLPAVLLVRVARAAARIDPAAFVRALPCTLAFLAAWAVGEAVGYWQGEMPRPGERVFSQP